MDKGNSSNLESSQPNSTTKKIDLDDLSNNIPERNDEGDSSTQDHSADDVSEEQSDEEIDDVSEEQSDEEMDEEFRAQLSSYINLFKQSLLNYDLSFLGNDEPDDSLYGGIIGKAMLANAIENSPMASLEVQEEMMTWYAQQVLKQIFEDLDGDVFSLLIEESSEISRMQQMAMVIRYVDKCGVVKERFIGLVPILETCVTSLKSAIDDFLARHNLSLSKVRGQSYDIACYLDDEFDGLRGLIMKESPSAYYVHCFAKELQRVMVDVKDLGVWQLFEMVENVMELMCASCKQQDMVQESQKERLKEALGCLAVDARSGLNQENYRVRKFGDRSWNAGYKALTALVSLHPSVLEVLDYIEKAGDSMDVRCQVDKVYIYLIKYDFVFYSHLMIHILAVTDTLSRCLQKKDQDLFNAVSLVKTTKLQLQKFRSEGFDSFLEKVNSFCEEHDIEMVKMGDDYINPIQRKQRTGITYRQYYEFECFNKVLDMQIRELEIRFNEVTSELLMCMSSLSPCDNFREFDIPKILRLAEMYPCDFDEDDKRRLKLELVNYIDTVKADERFANLDGLSTLVRLMVETKMHLSFTLVYRLLKLSLVLPIATASVERSFSAMKADLQNRFGDEYSNEICTIFMEKELLSSIRAEDTLERFPWMKTGEE